MPTAYIMVGCPGVGKGTYLKNHLTNIPVLSSDKTRLLLFNTLLKQDDESNKKVFSYIHNKINYFMKNKQSFVLDATNLNIWRRIGLYKDAHTNGFDVHAIVGLLSFKELCMRNENREEFKQVPVDVLKKMYREFSAPVVNVDCDEFTLFTKPYFKDEVNFDSLEEIINSVDNPYIQDELRLNYTEHGSSFHTESVNKHINLVINKSKKVNHEIFLTGVFHDLGKGITKRKNRKNKYYSYYNHEKYGSILAFNYLTNHQQFIDENFVKYALLHMKTFDYPFSRKFKRRLSISKKDEQALILFNQIDKSCSFPVNRAGDN